MNTVPSLLRFEGVTKAYSGAGDRFRHALKDVTFEVSKGEVVSVVGRSGSGKSTLLSLAAGIDVPSAGRVSFEERDLSRLSERERARIRRDAIGLVFQFFHLLPHLSVLENVALPELIAGGRASDFEPRIEALLARVGLGDRAGESVGRLSGGEMQRVAICRALLRRPRLLLADEPTGNLDDESGRTVMELMLELAREEGSTLVYVTHDLELASLARTHWRIHSGMLEQA